MVPLFDWPNNMALKFQLINSFTIASFQWRLKQGETVYNTCIMTKMCKKDKIDEIDRKKPEAAYICKKCGSSSNKEKKLCKPIKRK